MLAKEQEKLNSEQSNKPGIEETKTMICEYPIKEDTIKATAPDTSSTTIISSSSTSQVAKVKGSTSDSTVCTTAEPAGAKSHSYPMSPSGACPYCFSTNVKYIVLVDNKTKDSQLPLTLQTLLKKGKAFKMAKGEESRLNG